MRYARSLCLSRHHCFTLFCPCVCLPFCLSVCLSLWPPCLSVFLVPAVFSSNILQTVENHLYGGCFLLLLLLLSTHSAVFGSNMLMVGYFRSWSVFFVDMVDTFNTTFTTASIIMGVQSAVCCLTGERESYPSAFHHPSSVVSQVRSPTCPVLSHR